MLSICVSWPVCSFVVVHNRLSRWHLAVFQGLCRGVGCVVCRLLALGRGELGRRQYVGGMEQVFNRFLAAAGQAVLLVQTVCCCISTGDAPPEITKFSVWRAVGEPLPPLPWTVWHTVFCLEAQGLVHSSCRACPDSEWRTDTCKGTV